MNLQRKGQLWLMVKSTLLGFLVMYTTLWLYTVVEIVFSVRLDDMIIPKFRLTLFYYRILALSSFLVGFGVGIYLFKDRPKK